MKPLLLTTFLFLGLLSQTQIVNAQENQKNVGPSFMLPVGDYSEMVDFGIGISSRFEKGLSKQWAVGLGVEVLFFPKSSSNSINSHNDITLTFAIPAKLFVKYSFIEQKKGPYVAMNLGLYPFLFYKKNANGFTDAIYNIDFGWGPEVGVYILKDVGLALTYDVFYHRFIRRKREPFEPLSYLSLRTFLCF